MRLDKFLCELNIGSRSELKKIVRSGRVTVNGAIVSKPDMQIDESMDCITFDGNELHYEEFVYYMLNKPAGFVSATKDDINQTVNSILKDENHNDIFPIGRLDKDTVGLLLFTNDGDLAHHLLSPKHHIDKTYFVRGQHEISESDLQLLTNGIDIGDDKPTLPAKVERVNSNEINLTIHEGRYHQIKRMFESIQNEVTYLKRIRMGAILLDEQLEEGQYRRLTDEEVLSLRKKNRN